MGDVCKMELDAGPCMALFHRYGYSTEKGKCVEFSYGGCQGNANNFETMEAYIEWRVSRPI
ncbi:Kunitz/Bovine pancreatic trypsin inhibitor domain protein [Cooperia oncophora]